MGKVRRLSASHLVRFHNTQRRKPRQIFHHVRYANPGLQTYRILSVVLYKYVRMFEEDLDTVGQTLTVGN